jgi:thiamine biosynthesis lipoprotein ApbE
MYLMADPDSQAQLRAASAANGRALAGSVVANGRVSKRDSDEIVAEIERTRQSLARTIDTLADRVSPGSNVKRLRERASEELAKPEVQLAAAAVALALTGIVIYRVFGRRRKP